MHRRVVAVSAAVVVFCSCAPDAPDVYTADDETITTRAPREEEPTAEAATAAPVPPNGETVQVRSLDNTFRDAEIEVVAGTEVRWTNNGRNDHDVLPVDESMDWGVALEDFAPGAEYSHVFDTPGVYDYYCSIHGTKDAGMIGTVVVLPADV